MNTIVRTSDMDSDGRISMFPETGRIEILPKNTVGNGGYIDFHVNGNAEDFDARIIDYDNSFQLRVPTTNSKKIELNAAENQSVLTNSPTVPRTNKGSKAIATCGWANTVMEAALNNLNLSQYAKKTDLDDYVTLGTNQTISGVKTFHAVNATNSTTIASTYVKSEYLNVNHPTLGVVGGLHPWSAIGVELYSNLGGMTITALKNSAKLTNPPD